VLDLACYLCTVILSDRIRFIRMEFFIWIVVEAFRDYDQKTEASFLKKNPPCSRFPLQHPRKTLQPNTIDYLVSSMAFINVSEELESRMQTHHYFFQLEIQAEM
jgi:hypothetical protein